MLSFLLNQTLIVALSLSALFPSAEQIDDATRSAVAYFKAVAVSISANAQRNTEKQNAEQQGFGTRRDRQAPNTNLQGSSNSNRQQQGVDRHRHSRYFVAGSRRAVQVGSYRDLPAGQPLSQEPGASYYFFKTLYGSRVHLVVIDIDSAAWDLRPAVNATVDTTTHSAQARSAAATVNGGYFGLSDGASVSYVIVDGKEEASPRRNSSLLANSRLSRSTKDAIYNRSEMRILVSSSGKNEVVVAHHDEAIPNGFKLLHSLQAGPRLLPDLNTEKEAFVRQENGKTVDVIRSRQMVARTAFGVTADRRVLLVCVEGGEEQQGRGGATLIQLRQLMLDLGCVEALNLDGGSSSTMYVSYPDSQGRSVGHTVCRNNPERRVKSVLLLLKKKQQSGKIKVPSVQKRCK